MGHFGESPLILVHTAGAETPIMLAMGCIRELIITDAYRVSTLGTGLMK